MHKNVQDLLKSTSRHWLVTGSAGFIGSHLVENLLRLGQIVTSVDNFSTGYQKNLDEVSKRVGSEACKRHRFVKGDITDLATCKEVCTGVDFVLHQAALGSVPRSIEDPLTSHASNVNGFLNMLVAARDAKVSRFVFAGSSAVYGDHPGLPKFEDEIGDPLSPYAVTKYVNEVYAQVFGTCYGVPWISLRYFNVFGPRQDPNGAYAAVIPRWIDALLAADEITINGDGETSRDFCYVANVVQANIRAALALDPSAVGQVYNIAVGSRTTLNSLYETLRALAAEHGGQSESVSAVYGPFRGGDVRHSLADISKAHRLLGYEPSHTLVEGLRETVKWYAAKPVNRSGDNSQDDYSGMGTLSTTG